MAGLSSDAGERLFTSGHLSDFRITCQDREWPLHKNILCAASDFFRAACERDFKENGHGVLDLPDDNAATVHTLLKYLYTGKYVVKFDKVDPSSIDRQGRSGAPIWGDWEDPAFGTPPEDIIAKLRADFLVYKLSDKTGFRELTDKAYEEVETGLSPLVFPSPEFPKLMRLIYECTSARDELRFQLTKVCVRCEEKFSCHRAAVEVVEEFEYVAWRVGLKMKDQADYMYDLYLEQHALNTANMEKVKVLEAAVNPGGQGEI